MIMMSLNLNIDNYTRDELIQMFELPPHFDRNIVEIKEARLKELMNKEKLDELEEDELTYLTKELAPFTDNEKTIEGIEPDKPTFEQWKTLNNEVHDLKLEGEGLKNQPKVRTIPASSTVVLTDHQGSPSNKPKEYDYM